jgi:hypothetical protein
VRYWGQVFLASERPVPPDVLAEMGNISVQDKAFAPRFQAREILRAAELSVPLDNPGGVYAFKVRLTWARAVYRTIEMRSEQALDELHFAIQKAWNWDADHLYSFFMNGQLYDENYAFACPDDDEGPRWTTEAAVGELGLTLKHKFLYFFDYGDSHRFEIEVVDIKPKAERSRYPRVVDKQGQVPAQYGSWDDVEG